MHNCQVVCPVAMKRWCVTINLFNVYPLSFNIIIIIKKIIVIIIIVISQKVKGIFFHFLLYNNVVND